MTELLIQYRATKPLPTDSAGTANSTGAGPAVTPWNDQFTVALPRALELLDDAAALDLLAHGRLRELLYTIVEGPAGPAIQDTLGAPTHQLAAARVGYNSPSQFSREFKCHFGTTPRTWAKAAVATEL